MDWQRHVVGLVLVAALGACSPPEAPPPKPDPTEVDTRLVIDQVTTEERDDVGDPGYIRKPGTGALYVVVRYVVTNSGGTRAPSELVPEVHLVDPGGRTFNADPEATEVFRSEINAGVERGRSGDLNPGVAATKGIVFEISRTAWKVPGWTFGIINSEGQLVPLTPTD